MKKSLIYRWFFYVLGLVTIALGIILNTKSGFGVSAIISVAQSLSIISGVSIGDMTFVLYSVFVVMEIIIHCLQNKGKPKAAIIGKDLLQLPLSIVFTRVMNVFSDMIPSAEGVAARLLVLVLAIVLTGIGAAMSLDMRLVPNPGDGIVQALADLTHKPVGLTKNCFDLLNVCITISIGLIFAGKIIGVGLGTILAMLGIGRIIALFNHIFLDKMSNLAGMERAYA